MEFVKWSSTPRFFRDIVITEKIDGTNACVVIDEKGLSDKLDQDAFGFVATDSVILAIGAQSRKRLITPQDDNFGFARWVANNAEQLVTVLGPGRHFGEWWGSGIQRGYGLLNGDKRFSLFNVKKWQDADLSAVPGLDTVPVLYRGMMSGSVIVSVAEDLNNDGSVASPGFKPAEGVCVYHTTANQVFKYTPYEDNDAYKWQAAESKVDKA